MAKIRQKLFHTFLEDFLNADSVVVDLGANRGEFSEFIAGNYNSVVYAVEPVPDLFREIKSGPKIKKFSYCIKSENGPCRLNLPPNRCATTRNGDKSDSITVDGVTLENFLATNGISMIDLLKVDIEGEELNLFEEISGEVLRKIEQITIEFHDFLWPELRGRVGGVKEKLAGAGFYCIPFSLTNSGDVLFVKKDRLSFTEYLYLKWVWRYVLGLRRKFEKAFTAPWDGLKTRFSIILSLVKFLWVNKMWWMIPLVMLLMLFFILMIFAQSSPLGPFIYTIF